MMHQDPAQVVQYSKGYNSTVNAAACHEDNLKDLAHAKQHYCRPFKRYHVTLDVWKTVACWPCQAMQQQGPAALV